MDREEITNKLKALISEMRLNRARWEVEDIFVRENCLTFEARQEVLASYIDELEIEYDLLGEDEQEQLTEFEELELNGD